MKHINNHLHAQSLQPNRIWRHQVLPIGIYRSSEWTAENTAASGYGSNFSGTAFCLPHQWVGFLLIILLWLCQLQPAFNGEIPTTSLTSFIWPTRCWYKRPSFAHPLSSAKAYTKVGRSGQISSGPVSDDWQFWFSMMYSRINTSWICLSVSQNWIGIELTDFATGFNWNRKIGFS